MYDARLQEKGAHPCGLQSVQAKFLPRPSTHSRSPVRPCQCRSRPEGQCCSAEDTKSNVNDIVTIESLHWESPAGGARVNVRGRSTGPCHRAVHAVRRTSDCREQFSSSGRWGVSKGQVLLVVDPTIESLLHSSPIHGSLYPQPDYA